MSTENRRQVHLAAHFPGVNSTTIWSDPRHESQIDFSAFRHFAENAERGFFDYLFLAEGLRLREQKGRIFEADVAGRPNTLAILAAVAAVTEHIGLVATLNSTINEPYELARQLSTLDYLSGGRAGWNVVTSPDAFHGANFRRGQFLDFDKRYQYADEVVALVKKFWAAAGQDDATVRYQDEYFDIEGELNLGQSPQGFPLIVQAGDSADGRDFAAKNADVIFSAHPGFDEGQEFYRDVKSRLAQWGRSEDSLKILPAATFVIGDNKADAEEKAHEISLAQTSPAVAISFLERVWGTDLSGLDPDGPLPDFDPVEPNVDIAAGRVRHILDPIQTGREWKELAETRGLSIRQLVATVGARQAFVGTPTEIAQEINRYVQERASDGFVIVGTHSPHGLDEFTEKIIPELQTIGTYRDSYDTDSLREHLGVRRFNTATRDLAEVPVPA